MAQEYYSFMMNRFFETLFIQLMASEHCTFYFKHRLHVCSKYVSALWLLVATQSPVMIYRLATVYVSTLGPSRKIQLFGTMRG